MAGGNLTWDELLSEVGKAAWRHVSALLFLTRLCGDRLMAELRRHFDVASIANSSEGLQGAGGSSDGAGTGNDGTEDGSASTGASDEEEEGGQAPAAAPSATEDGGDEDAKRLHAYQSRKKEPWVALVGSALSNSDERRCTINSWPADDYDPEVEGLEGGTMDEEDIWEYAPKHA